MENRNRNELASVPVSIFQFPHLPPIRQDDMKHNTANRQNGVTLIELSIVIVILGLLVGVVMGGQSLLLSMKIRSVVANVKGFMIATDNFREKYNSLPGDMVDASEYWADCDTPATLCNGNGNERIESGGEDLRVWQQLADSDMIEGDYTGSGSFEVDVNLPPSRFTDSGYIMYYNSALYGSSSNAIQFGGISSTDTRLPILNARDAMSVDILMDDGLAASGDVVTTDANGYTGCVDTSATPNKYTPDDETALCIMYFWLQ